MSLSLASYLKVVLCMPHFYSCIKSWDTDSMVCSRLCPSLVLNFPHPILMVYLKYLAMILLPESKGALRVCPFLCTFFISVCIICFTCLFSACHSFADGFQGRNPELCKSNPHPNWKISPKKSVTHYQSWKGKDYAQQPLAATSSTGTAVAGGVAAMLPETHQTVPTCQTVPAT